MDMCRHHGGSCRNREKYNDCPDGFYVKGLCLRKCHKTQCCISSNYDHTILDFSMGIYCKHVLFADSDVFLNHQFLIVKDTFLLSNYFNRV
jgi:hypothetical protein